MSITGFYISSFNNVVFDEFFKAFSIYVWSLEVMVTCVFKIELYLGLQEIWESTSHIRTSYCLLECLILTAPGNHNETYKLLSTGQNSCKACNYYY